MPKIVPTLRERQAFAALMDELLGHARDNQPVAYMPTRDVLFEAHRKMKAKADRMALREAAEQAAIQYELDHTDYRD